MKHNTDKSEERLEKLIEKFWARFQGNAFSGLDVLVAYPGGFELITSKDANRAKLSSDGIGYIARIFRDENGNKIINPCFKIKVLKDWFDNATDREVLFMIAHELSHAVMQIRHGKWHDYAADVLAEHYFGIKKPKGSTLGYLYDEEAFEKVYGKILKK